MLRHFQRCFSIAALAIGWGCASLPPAVAYAPHHPPNFRIRLLPGYRLEEEQGIDTTVWRLRKPGGLDITYDGGDLPTDEPREYKPVSTWIRECYWNDGPMNSNRPASMPTPTPHNERGDADCGLWIADNGRMSLSVGFPNGAYFSARELKSVDQVREMLAIVLTYAPGSFDPAMFIDGPTLQRQIDRGWNVGRHGPKLMGDAVRWEAVDVIKVLARAGVDVNGVNADGVPYLHEAIQFDLYQSAKALLDAGAKPILRTPKGLFVPVAGAYSPKMLQLLLDRRVDVNAAGAGGTTMLMAATSAGNIGSVRALLDRGAAINAQDSYGRTALMNATRGHLDIVALLIERGAALDLRDKEGKTALGMAESQISGSESLIRRSEEALRELPPASSGAPPDVNRRVITRFVEDARRDLAIAKDVAALLIKHGAGRD